MRKLLVSASLAIAMLVALAATVSADFPSCCR